ncbi:MAG: Hsp70 family protein [Verrucomicrobia bacterium]|nr:Hsp70 family protein [Verrucomicrobiota bacterium]
MPGRLGIDFGTSNTVVAVWDDSRREGVTLHIPDFGRLCHFSPCSNSFSWTASDPVEQASSSPVQGVSLPSGSNGELPPQPADKMSAPDSESGSHPSAQAISVIPTLIHYAEDGRRWIGEQVCQKNLVSSPRTFSLIKRYITNRSPVTRRLGAKTVSHFEAGRDFLSAVILFAAQELNLRDEEVALTVPVEAYEHYVDWFTRVVEASGLPRFRLIDEPSAAALGYGAHVQPGSVYLIFDFGGGTLDVAVVLIEEEDRLAAGRRCRVLGKAGRELGGSTIDTWIFQEVLRRNHRSDADDDIRGVSAELLAACRAIKEELSSAERAAVHVAKPGPGTALSAEFTRADFEELLDRHDVFSQIDHTIRRALNGARDRGYGEDQIRAALMVGGSSLIPAVQKTVQRIFGKELVRLERPLDAVARGAAAFVAGVDFYDHIQHDYAIRWTNRQKGDYEYRLLVERGTPYPTREPVRRLTVKASYDGQVELGIAIFEIGECHSRGDKPVVELVFDPSGAARVMEVPPDEAERRTYFWINEQSPTFLRATPAAQQGEPRFAVEFGIDAHKRLLITARDLKTGQLTLRDYPVVKLV